MKKFFGFPILCLMICQATFSQVDASFIYRTNTPYGTLDLRLAKSSTRYYYLQENKTFSFRKSPGVKTNTYRDMTSWDSSPYKQGNLREKIRAVGNSGRSDYTPAANNQFLIITTSGDTQNPAVPQNLTATSTGIREIKLEWQASSDNTGIREYNIYYGSQVISTGSAVTTFKLRNLPLNTNFTFTVRAKDFGNNLSGESNPASGSTFVNGLYYEHTTGAFSDIDLINWSIAEFEGTVDNFTLSPRTQEDYFNFQFEGYLYINRGGTYQFQTYSDDGSRVTIDNVVVVDNDGQHGPRTITGAKINLSSGPRLINVKYFEYTAGQTLVVRYNGPDTGNNWVAISDAALRSGSTFASSNMIANTSEAAGRMMSEATGEESIKSENVQMDVYPNPSRPSDNITVQVTGSHDPVNIKLMDMMGKSYYENTLSADQFETGIQITPSEHMIRGLYIMVITQGNKTLKQKVIVKE